MKKIRFKKITNNPLQKRYLFVIVLAMAVPLVIMAGCLYYLIFQLMAEQLGIPESIAYNLFPVVNQVNTILLIALPPVMIVLFALGLVLSHRLIGPLNRLENDLRQIAEGDYSIRLAMRKDDDLKPIANAINVIIDKLEKKG